jgi:hypothetical protein
MSIDLMTAERPDTELWEIPATGMLQSSRQG